MLPPGAFGVIKSILDVIAMLFAVRALMSLPIVRSVLEFIGKQTLRSTWCRCRLFPSWRW